MTVEELLSDLKSDNASKRSAALFHLKQLPLDDHSACALVRAAADRYVSTAGAFWGVRVTLLMRVWPYRGSVVEEAVRDVYPALSGDNNAMQAALRLLAEQPTGSALHLLLDLLRRPQTAGARLISIFVSLRRHPFVTELYPDILEWQPRPPQRLAVLELTLALLRDRRLAPHDVACLAPWCIQALDEVLTSATGQDDARHLAEGSADLLGFMPQPSGLLSLQKALWFGHPRLRAFAALALIRQGQTPGDSFVMGLASDPNVRARFYEGLADMGRTDLFPERWATQDALAESAMVEWLCHPSELGGPPEEIETILKHTVDISDEGFVFYLMRFRTGGQAATDWMVGLTGPYQHGTLSPRGWATFSAYEPVTARTLSEHLEHLLATVLKIRERATVRSPEEGQQS